MNRAGGGRASLAGLAAMAVLGLAAAGCGGDDDEGNGGGESQAAKPSKLAIEATGSAKKPTLSVPKSVKGGVVEITFTNSAKGTHGAQLIAVEGDQTPQQALAAGNGWGQNGEPLPDWLIPAGGVGSVPPGKSASVTQELAAGRYLVFDIDTNAYAELEVTGDSGSGELTADGTIDATEYEFTSTGLKAGNTSVLFENTGSEPHFIAGIGMKPGSNIEDVRRFFRTEKGEPPIDESRNFSTAVIDGGDSQAIDVELEEGKYALLCFVPDRAGGPPHVVKGMISEATVGG